MYTELTVLFKKDLPENLSEAFEGIMGPSKDVHSVMDEALDLADGFEVYVPDVVYAGNSHEKLFFILRGGDIRTIKIHLENKDTTSPSKVKGLKECIESMYQALKMFSKRNKIKIKSLKAVIVAEEEQIEIGKLQTKWQNIYEVIKKEYEKEIFLAISFFIMSVIASILYKSGNQLSSAGQPSGSIVESSANDLLILILALLFILFLRFLFYQPSLKYE